MKRIRTLLKPICLLLLVCAYLVFLNRSGKFNIAYHDRELSAIQPDQGFAFLADAGDPNIARGKLPVAILEDGHELQRDFTHTTETVRLEGKGSFVVWENGILCFSASDNTNPMENGRVYEVIYPAIAGNRLARFVYASCGLFFLLTMLSYAPIVIRGLGKQLAGLRGNPLALLPGLAAIPFSFFAFRFLLRQSLWADEIYTLSHYCLDPDLFYAATTYDFPNNHIFLNLILSAWLRLVKIISLDQAVLTPWIVRLPLFLFGGLTIFFTVKSAGQSGKAARMISAIILCTTLPFYAWGTQIRGYSLSLFLISLLFYLILLHRRKPARATAAGATVTSALLMYTLPFNAVFVAAMLLFLFIEMLLTRGAGQTQGSPHPQTIREKIGCLLRQPATKLLIALLFGLLLTMLLYYPVGDQLLEVYLPGKAYAPVSGSDQLSNFFHTNLQLNFAGLLQGFFQGRTWLALIAVVAVGFLLFAKKSREIFSYPVRLSAAVILIPFLLCGLTGYAPFNRNFLPLLPICVLLVSSWIGSAAQAIFRGRWLAVFMAALFLCANIAFAANLNRIRTELPDGDFTRIDNLSAPYFISQPINPDAFLTAVKAMNREKLPVLTTLPGDFYFHDLCAAYDTVCYPDYIGPQAQSIVQANQPFLLLRTISRENSDDSLPDAYQQRCDSSPLFSEGAYLLYNCNASFKNETF